MSTNAAQNRLLPRALAGASSSNWIETFQAFKRERRFKEAQDLLFAQFGGAPHDVDNGLLLAQYLNEVKAVELAYEVYENLMASGLTKTGQAQVRLEYARRLFGHGFAKRACLVLQAVSLDDSDSNFLKHRRKMEAICKLLEQREGRELKADENTRTLAFKHAIAFFRERQAPAIPEGRTGRITLLTGSLGGGGAERQLSRLAIGLTQRYQQGGRLAGLWVDEPVHLVLRSLNPAAGNDFFLDDVLQSGCVVHEIDAMPACQDLGALCEDVELRLLLLHQPGQVTYGLFRLVDFFRQTRPDFLAIWQDGACLYSVLAALIAGVPKIQIGLRGLPPVMRSHLFRPEYEPMYKAIDQVPGIDFLTNSLTVADAYSQWLGISAHKFHIVYNGVMPPVSGEDAQALQLWANFVSRTPDARRTVGGVFRFATDKRPNTWIRFAKKMLSRHPDTRFVIVGSGDLMASAMSYAQKLGIERQILFVGASSAVGFWMDQMDVMVLLSQFEGLPNVLIEAQLKHIPVVTTPAGGARECLVPGVSGVCLDAVEPVDFFQAVDAAVHLSKRPRTEMFDARVQAYLHDRFAVETMTERFLHALRASLGTSSPMGTSGLQDTELGKARETPCHSD